MNLEKYKNFFFIGIGGIGMSAIARYFNAEKKNVIGYDKTPTVLTNKLIKEGIKIHFDDCLDFIPDNFSIQNTIVVYTPAIPINNKQLLFFKESFFTIKKRAEVLGIISENNTTLAIAGTHGKTSISSMLSMIMYNSKFNNSAFVGGIIKNIDSNFFSKQNNLKSEKIITIEADEFDFSFLNFYPQIALISSIDADHLDIYKNKENLKNNFQQFVNQINKGGCLVIKKKIENEINFKNKLTYSLDNKEANVFAMNIKLIEGKYYFDINFKGEIIKNILLQTNGLLNVENSVAAVAVAKLSGVSNKIIKQSLSEFQGVYRRFDYKKKTKNQIFIDDYAHHPTEIKASLNSIRKLYKTKKILCIFQPHLYSRTKDFYREFAESLEIADEIVLLEIYPAREVQTDGISSALIFDNVKNKNKIYLKAKNNRLEENTKQVLNLIKNKKIEVLVTLGAGDIDKIVEVIDF